MGKLIQLTFLVLVCILIFVTPKISVAQGLPYAPDMPITNDPFLQPALLYAEDYGVTVEEAKNRLSLQNEIGLLNGALEKFEPDIFGGLWIQHSPDFRVVIKFTDANFPVIDYYVTNPMIEDLIEVKHANVTYAELEFIQEETIDSFLSVNQNFSSGINIIEGRVEIYVKDELDFQENLQKSNIEYSPFVDIIKTTEKAVANTNIYA